MASGDLIRRLEAVASRLEAYANNLPASGGGGGGGGGPRVREEKVPANVQSYNEFYAAAVTPFATAARHFKETAYIGDLAEQAFKHAGVFLQAASKCKKPDQKGLMTFLTPITSAMADAERKSDSRSPWFPQQKSFHEGLNALNFLVAPGDTKATVIAGLEQADFYLIKILNLAKTKTGDEQNNLRAFVATFKAIFNKLGEFADEYHPKGVDWNPRGGDLSSFTPSSASAATPPSDDSSSGAPPPPPGPPPSAEELSGSAAAAEVKVGGSSPGMGAVFGAINRGLDVTKGLKKVDSSMKTKHMKDVPVLAPKERKDEGKSSAKKFAVAAEVKKPAKLELSKGTWFCENYEDTTIDIPDVELKQSVYIVKARNCTINIPNKCKSISVDSSFKTRIVFRQIVSVFELFNSQRCVAECLEVFPAINIDKSNGCIVVISRDGLATPPQIVSSNISECNIQVPGATDEADPIEIPLPEQYETNLNLGGPPYKLTTRPIAHGD